MNVYKKMYHHLSDAVTDVLNVLATDSEVAEYLCRVQRECEEIFRKSKEEDTDTETP